jgi:dihydropyrimidinase
VLNCLLLLAGKQIKGKVTTTVSRGRLVWHDGKLDVPKGSGRFIPLAPFGSLYDGLEKQGSSTVAQLVSSFASRQGPTPVMRSEGSSEGAAAGGSGEQQQPGHEEL